MNLRRLLIILAGMAMIASGSVSAGVISSPDQVFELFKQDICKSELASLGVFVTEAPLPEGTVIRTWRGPFETLVKPEWLLFIDDHPGANWEHSCRYIFVNPEDGTYRVVPFTRPPTILKGMIRFSGPDPFAGENLRPETRRPLRQGRSPEHLYAVILSGGADSGNNHVRYWNDCSNIYITLTEVYGYLDDHIIVAISDGTNPAPDQSNGQNSDPDLDGDGDADIMYSCINTNLTTIFSDLASTLTSLDTLFIFTTDHGSGQYGVPNQPTSMNLWNSEIIWDYNFAALLEPINCREMILTLEPCFSGGFVNDVINMNSTVPRVISTAANDMEYSWAMPPDYVYDTYVFHWTAAVKGEDAYGSAVDADTNNDGEVDMLEAYTYALAADTDDEHPQYAEWPTGYGSTVTLGGSGPTSEGTASLDRGMYNCDGTVTIIVEDLDLDGTGTLNVTIQSDTETTPEQVVLTETDTAHFEGSIETAEGAAGADGILQVAHGDLIEVAYTDDNYGSAGVMVVTATADVDCVEPVISSVMVDMITDESAEISWTTDEPADSVVMYGSGGVLNQMAFDDELVTDHVVALEGLEDCEYYQFYVLSSDAALNEAMDNNSGSNYSFITLELNILFEETMDSDPGWVISGGEWAWGIPAGNAGDPDAGYTGSAVYGYDLNGAYNNSIPEYFLTTPSFDCSTTSTVILSFYRWLGVESSQWDHAYIRVGVNGSFTNIWTHSGATVTDTSWTYTEFDISSLAAGQSDVQVRWVMGTTDSSVVYSGWNIDDVQIAFTEPCVMDTPTPAPTSTPSSTPVPPTPTFTPVPTVTPTDPPEPTQTPAPTVTPTPAPTDTPTATDLGMDLILDDTDLEPGDRFHLHMWLNNPTAMDHTMDVYLLLGVYGNYWCWPSWQDLSLGLDFDTRSVASEDNLHEEILDFVWPSGAGSASGLQFIACMFEPGTFIMMGSPELIDWQYR